MSEPTRDDLRVYNPAGPHLGRKITDTEFEAIVDADPRWVRTDAAIGISNEAGEIIAEWERHGRIVTQNCDTCNGTGTTTDGESWGPDECLYCVDGKVPADGVEIDQFDDTGPVYLVPVQGADDE